MIAGQPYYPDYTEYQIEVTAMEPDFRKRRTWNMPGTRKLGRPTAHRNAMLRGMVTYLIENGSIETTLTRAKEVRAIAEKMITLAINTYQDTVKVTKQKVNQKNEKVDVEFTNDGPKKLAARRTMMAYLPDLQEQKAAKESKESFRNRTADINHPLIEKLFGEYAPKYAKRAEDLHTAGGYTSIIRTTERHGDNAQLCILKLVD